MADTLTAVYTALAFFLALVVAIGGHHGYQLLFQPGRSISYWLEDGCIVIHNRSGEPIFDVIPHVYDRAARTRKVFRYMPSHVEQAEDAGELSHADDTRVTFHAPSIPPGMWAVELSVQIQDPREIGLTFENARGLLFRLEHGRVRTRVGRSGAAWLGTKLPQDPELAFTRISEDELGGPFQRPSAERTTRIMSSQDTDSV